jgi:hypothetical protein
MAISSTPLVAEVEEPSDFEAHEESDRLVDHQIVVTPIAAKPSKFHKYRTLCRQYKKQLGPLFQRLEEAAVPNAWLSGEEALIAHQNGVDI